MIGVKLPICGWLQKMQVVGSFWIIESDGGTSVNGTISEKLLKSFVHQILSGSSSECEEEGRHFPIVTEMITQVKCWH